MSKLRELAYAIDPSLWVTQVLGFEPTAWQSEFLRAPQGASILVLTARQVGRRLNGAPARSTRRFREAAPPRLNARRNWQAARSAFGRG